MSWRTDLNKLVGKPKRTKKSKSQSYYFPLTQKEKKGIGKGIKLPKGYGRPKVKSKPINTLKIKGLFPKKRKSKSKIRLF